MQETVVCESLDQLSGIAARLLEKFPKSRIFAFYGNMGAGKTTFIKELCKQLSVQDVVNSPTFAIVNEYISENSGSVFHFDLYRLNSWKELFDIGYEDYFFGGSYCLIEWPEKIEDLLPDDTIRVKIELAANEKRTFTF
jgi:tRNA threonylcarbamoyladenosine biosynthesis protein TsaE